MLLDRHSGSGIAGSRRGRDC